MLYTLQDIALQIYALHSSHFSENYDIINASEITQALVRIHTHTRAHTHIVHS